MKSAIVVLVLLGLIGLGSFFYFSTNRQIVRPAILEQNQMAGRVYRNEAHGFTLEYTPPLEVKEYGPDNATIGTKVEGGVDAIAEVSVFTVDGKAGQTMQDAVANHLMSLCAADGPMGSFTCTSVSDQEAFTTTSGVEGEEIILWGEDSNFATKEVIEEKRGPFYVIPLATSATVTKVLAIYSPLSTSYEDASLETIEAIAKSVQLEQTPAGANGSIETYVKENISKLSPVKEQLGGTFYVTEIAAHGGAGTVWYEDGHSAYTADFTYEGDEMGKPKVTSFTVRED